MTLLRILTSALVVISLGRADDLTDDLLAATRKGDLAQVKALLDKGASVNSKSPYGQTPLFFACDRGYVDIVKLLLDRGAEVNHTPGKFTAWIGTLGKFYGNRWRMKARP